MHIAGIDEAGRGPVIGPLVICCAVIETENLQKLEALGVKDSKLLTPKKREQLAKTIPALLHSHEILIIPVEEIDKALNNPSLNLNWLEAIKTAILLNKLHPEKAIIDCPSNNIPAYKKYLEQLLKEPIPIILEHNAERNTIVAAASILAKVTRDAEIEKLKKEHGDFGSGYPSDQKTKVFLQRHWKNKAFLFRKTWASYKNLDQQTLAQTNTNQKL